MFLCSNLGSAVNFRLRLRRRPTKNFTVIGLNQLRPVVGPFCHRLGKVATPGVNIRLVFRKQDRRIASIGFLGSSKVVEDPIPNWVIRRLKPEQAKGRRFIGVTVCEILAILVFQCCFLGCSMVGNRNQSSGRTQNGISKKNSSGVHGNNGKTAGNSGGNLGNLPASAVVNTGDESVQPLESNSGNVGQNSVRESANGNNGNSGRNLEKLPAIANENSGQNKEKPPESANDYVGVTGLLNRTEQNQTNSSNTAGSDALNRDVMNSQGPLKNVPLNLMAPGRHAAYGKGIEVQRAGRLNGDRTVRNSNLNVDQNPEKNLDRNYQNKQNKQSANPGSGVMNEAQNCGNNPASSEQNEQIGQSPLPAASGNRDCSEQTVSQTLGSTDTLSVDGMNEEDAVFGTRQSKWIPKQNHNLNLENNLKERETEKGKNQNEEQKDNDNVEGDPVAETVLVSEENQGVEQERASDLGQNTNCQTDMVEHSEEEDGNTTEYEPESDDLSTEYEEEIEEPTLKANNRPKEGSHTCSNLKSVDGGNAQPAEELFGTQEEGIQN
nr:hypothetical protein Iba_chr04cCG14390 [Ipomoea batatas]